MSGLDDGFCWYRDSNCPTTTAALCDEVPMEVDYSTSLRLCACRGSRRRLETTNTSFDASSPESAERHVANAKEAADLRAAAERAAERIALQAAARMRSVLDQKRAANEAVSVPESAAACPQARGARDRDTRRPHLPHRRRGILP